MNRIVLSCLLLLAAMSTASAQTLNFNTYIDSIRCRNASFLAQQLNVDISKAEVQAAHATDDPALSVEYGNNSDWNIEMGQSVSAEISKAIAPGKLAARVAVAKQQLTVSQAESADYWRNLKADASIDFYNALLAKELLSIDSQAYQNMAALAASDSLRFVKGEISELDMLQSRLEQYRAHQELNSKRTDYMNALLVLDQQLGAPAQGTRAVIGSLAVPTEMFSLPQLLEHAFNSRADLVAAEQSVVLVQKEERLALKERRSDVEMALGANYNTQVMNEEAPAPQFVGYTVGLSIPLPVASVNAGVRKAGKLRLQQAELERQSLRNEVHGEVLRAYNVYLASLQKVKSYSEHLMSNANKVLDGKLYAYQRGDTSLLEVLSAQHTYNEIQEEYVTCLYDCMVALAELQRSAGL
ncbi:MAG: TolC family protein [Bacteroidales bacterium]|nr:TolC family protein [Candidatus Colimorpha merdihippi]